MKPKNAIELMQRPFTFVSSSNAKKLLTDFCVSFDKSYDLIAKLIEECPFVVPFELSISVDRLMDDKGIYSPLLFESKDQYDAWKITEVYQTKLILEKFTLGNAYTKALLIRIEQVTSK